MSAKHKTPEQLEEAIVATAASVERLYLAGDVVGACDASKRVAELVAMRSPETVAAMEKERGLA